VICTNSDAHTPGMYVADEAIVVPPSYSEDYIPAILEICRRNDIRLLCSFHDLDLLVLSRHKDALRNVGVEPILPEPAWGEICIDKYRCTTHLADHGFPVPWATCTFDDAIAALADGRLQFPVVMKARFGFGSLGLRHSNSIEH